MNEKPLRKRTGRKPRPDMAKRRQKAKPEHSRQDTSRESRDNGKTQKQTHAPHNSRKPSIHSLGTQAAGAMQVTRPNVTWSPGVRLHPKAGAAFGLEAECATPKHLGTPVAAGPSPWGAAAVCWGGPRPFLGGSSCGCCSLPFLAARMRWLRAGQPFALRADGPCR